MKPATLNLTPQQQSDVDLISEVYDDLPLPRQLDLADRIFARARRIEVEGVVDSIHEATAYAMAEFGARVRLRRSREERQAVSS